MRRILLIVAYGVCAAALAPLPFRLATARAAESTDRLELGALPGDEDLVRLLWQRSPDLVAARAKMENARGEVERAHVLPNPELDLSLNNYPVGQTNPPGLNPWSDVVNYAVGLSEQVELGKRGPRQSSAQSAFTASRYDTFELLRQRYLDLLEKIAEVAAAEVNVAALEELAGDAARLTELQRQRANAGDTAGLDVDRAFLEEEKLQANLSDGRQRLSNALLGCSQAAGVPCLPFGGREKAEAFLDRALPVTQAPAVEERPDLKSLAAQEDSARAALALARAHAIPDPTLRVGYVFDRFVVSGNQPRALFFGVSLPLTVFDHGQADARQAAANLDSAARQRELLRVQAERDLARLLDQQKEAVARRKRMREQTLPLAREIVRRLEGAVQGKGAPLQDLLLARRTLGELSVDAAELDLLTFHLSASLARAGAFAPPLPAELRESLPVSSPKVSP